MKKKLNCILLVDDDKVTNFVSQRVIDRMGCTEKVEIAQNGLEAIDLLKAETDGKYICPDLIFLDINMPGMNGWEFLEEYKKLDEEQRGKHVIVMLTTSLNPDDRNKANEIEDISYFRNKPLTEQVVNDILERSFPDQY